MKILELEQDIKIFVFPAEDARLLGLSVTVIFNGSNYMIIDTGYEQHINKVFELLEKDDCEYVFCTHFHPDHTYGLYQLEEKVKLIGSKNYSDTLTDFGKEDSERLIPDIIVDNELNFEYGRHNLDIKLNKGHSNCGTLSILNDKYIFVGDDIMYLNNGEPSLPFLASKDPSQQIKALENIRGMVKNRVIVPAHGYPVFDEVASLMDIENRIIYLRYALDKRKYQDFFEETRIVFKNTKWHHYNIK